MVSKENMLGRGSFTTLTEAERGEEWLFSFQYSRFYMSGVASEQDFPRSGCSCMSSNLSALIAISSQWQAFGNDLASSSDTSSAFSVC